MNIVRTGKAEQNLVEIRNYISDYNKEIETKKGWRSHPFSFLFIFSLAHLQIHQNPW